MLTWSETMWPSKSHQDLSRLQSMMRKKIWEKMTRTLLAISLRALSLTTMTSVKSHSIAQTATKTPEPILTPWLQDIPTTATMMWLLFVETLLSSAARNQKRDWFQEVESRSMMETRSTPVLRSLTPKDIPFTSKWMAAIGRQKPHSSPMSLKEKSPSIRKP